MGAKASTPATSGHQSPRSRTFSSSSTGAELTSSSVDRQRARSLSSVPDMHAQATGTSSGDHNQHTHASNSSSAANSNNYASSSSTTTMSSQQQHQQGHNNHLQRHTLGDNLRGVSMAGASFVESIALAAQSASNGAANSIGRVYTATSLPSQIWSFNGIKCPVCNKFVLPDDIECHLVMCLTKPRLSYNEDVLSDAKGECVICLEDLNPGDIIARLPCLCIYHKCCIDRWFEVNRSCPEHPGD
ncbi:E3 ubiquitin-protein ligase znrf2 isoform X2 [Lucilia cuprina]|uniref:E3 ubiquitin-protein ligase znrf2 isoform X2 n=1 Tax=Lucilia cuprina TaxID=7375 RepID=UPI001F062F2E|nr:E3 ubiquitin-protein ligase znrf2 isoform X2 [Lucilia cuprina]